MTGRFRRVDEIPQDQAAVVGANIRVLRQQHGWNQAKLGELMGWPSNSTVCAAEGRRNGRQRGFTTQEVERLAAIFGVSPAQLTMRVRELRRAPAGRVRLPDMRSPPPDMKPQSTARASKVRQDAYSSASVSGPPIAAAPSGELPKILTHRVGHDLDRVVVGSLRRVRT